MGQSSEGANKLVLLKKVFYLVSQKCAPKQRLKVSGSSYSAETLSMLSKCHFSHPETKKAKKFSKALQSHEEAMGRKNLKPKK